MPYEISFTKRVPILESEQYINECCVGGDAVVDRFLPSVRARYEDIDTGQEDWGWFIWFRSGAVKLAIDVFTDDAERGEFRVRLTSRLKRWIFDSVADTAELEVLCEQVRAELENWAEGPIVVERVDERQ